MALWCLLFFCVLVDLRVQALATPRFCKLLHVASTSLARNLFSPDNACSEYIGKYLWGTLIAFFVQLGFVFFWVLGPGPGSAQASGVPKADNSRQTSSLRKFSAQTALWEAISWPKMLFGKKPKTNFDINST